MRVPPKAKHHRWEDSWSNGTGRRSDPTNETSELALRTPSIGVEATPRRMRGSSWERVSKKMAFFLADVMKMAYSEDEIFAVLHESDQDRKCRRVLAKVTETAAAHRLLQMKDLLALEKLATWGRMNGFDRVVGGIDNWFHGPRSLPPIPQEFTESLWCEVNALKDASSMPAQPMP